jgi:hypothetical protein
MGGQKGGSADPSGMFQALASAQAANQAYSLGTQQLDWAKQQWNAEQPYVQQIMTSDIASQQQAAQFAQEQEQLYQTTYQPLEQQYATQAQQWASPAQQSINAGAAMTNVSEASEAQRSSAQEQLEGFGINPGSTRFAGLDIGARTTQAAAEAGAGTSAVQATKLQGLGLEAGVVNTGRGLPNTTAGLASTGVGAGSAAAGVGASNISTGSSALTAPSNWFNTGASNMNTYVNAVNGYNQSQLGYAQVGAMQSAGFGALAGGLGGAALGNPSITSMLQEGGPAIPPQGNPGNVTASPGATVQSAVPPNGTPGGAIPTEASPTGGQETDDVPARLTVGEFVWPKDVVEWEGQKKLYAGIDRARQERQMASQRNDIGGERGYAPPARPTFVSRPGASNPAIPHARGVQYGGPITPGVNKNWNGGGPSTTYGSQSGGAIPTQRLLQRRAVG